MSFTKGVDASLVVKSQERHLDKDVPQKDGHLILEDAGFNSTDNNTDRTNNQIIHDLNDVKDSKKIDTSKIIKNDVDEFGQPRLIERKSRGKMFFVSNPLFKGSELNSRGEKTHMVYVKNGVRSVYPDRTYRKFECNMYQHTY